MYWIKPTGSVKVSRSGEELKIYFEQIHFREGASFGFKMLHLLQTRNFSKKPLIGF